MSYLSAVFLGSSGCISFLTINSNVMLNSNTDSPSLWRITTPNWKLSETSVLCQMGEPTIFRFPAWLHLHLAAISASLGLPEFSPWFSAIHKNWKSPWKQIHSKITKNSKLIHHQSWSKLIISNSRLAPNQSYSIMTPHALSFNIPFDKE